MTPQSFDIDTCKEVVGDARMRVIEAKARQDADNGVMDAPAMTKGTYWDGVYSYMEYVVCNGAPQTDGVDSTDEGESMIWKIQPRDGYFCFYQGIPEYVWWHVRGTSQNRWSAWFPTLDEVFQKLRREHERPGRRSI